MPQAKPKKHKLLKTQNPNKTQNPKHKSTNVACFSFVLLCFVWALCSVFCVFLLTTYCYLMLLMYSANFPIFTVSCERVVMSRTMTEPSRASFCPKMIA